MPGDGGGRRLRLRGAAWSRYLIYQPFIPALSGRLPFATKVEALAAGRLVCRKLADGQAPALSREEVESCLTDTGL